jgi:hypothetical protein
MGLPTYYQNLRHSDNSELQRQAKAEYWQEQTLIRSGLLGFSSKGVALLKSMVAKQVYRT